jgi:hypothetical protein
MAFYFVTGKLGNGKSLVSVSRILEKMKSGCRIATNIDLNLQVMSSKYTRNLNVVRVPDKPLIHDLEAIGKGTESYDEARHGLLVLDECGSWFNSRNWQDKSRAAVNDWFRHARKLGWDVILIVQDISLIDAQARDALSEHVVFCKRMDNMRIPFITPLFGLIGIPLKFPKMHIARVVLGTSPTDLMADRWIYKGTHLYQAYDTKQIFSASNDFGSHSLLTPWHLNRRQLTTRNVGFYMRLTKIYLKKIKSPLAIFAGIFLGIATSYAMTIYANDQFYKEYLLLQDGVKKLESIQTQSKDLGGLPSNEDIYEVDMSRFESWKIVGYSSYKNSDDFYFDFQSSSDSKDSETDARVISSRELLGSYDVKPLSPCHARIQSGGAFADVYCF